MFGQSDQRPICSFYQKGNCKFGTGCYNYHPGAVQDGGFGGSSAQPGQPKDATTLQTFRNQVITEMNQWESSGMWLLSVLAPLKEHPLFPGFADYSPEELRSDAYESKKSNNFTSYENKVRERLEMHKKIRMALKSGSPEAMDVMKSVYYKTASGSIPAQNQTGSLFGKPSGTSMFGGSSSGTSSGANNIFAQKGAPSTFGGPATFGSAASSQSAFGAFKSSSSVFGGQASNSVFGNATSNQNSVLFGNSSSQSQNASLFSAQPSPQSGNVFGGSQQNNIFSGSNQNQNKSVFGSSAQQAPNTTSLFGNPLGGRQQTLGANSIFGGGQSATQQASNTPVFGGAQSGNLQPTNTNSVFAGQQSGIQQPPNASSVFGGAQNNAQPNTNSNSLFNNSQALNQQIPNAVSPFASAQSGTSLFGGLANTQQGSSVFGNSSQAPSTVFGGSSQSQSSNSLFGGSAQKPNPSSLFTNPSTGSTPSIFGGANATQQSQQTQNLASSGNVFGGQQSQTGSLATTTPGNLFGGSNQPNTNNVFGGNSQQQSTNSVFGLASQTTNAPPFGVTLPPTISAAPPNNQPSISQSPNPPLAAHQSPSTLAFSSNTNSATLLNLSTLYTALQDLTAEDKAEFESNFFTRIPLCPPPRELCH